MPSSPDIESMSSDKRPPLRRPSNPTGLLVYNIVKSSQTYARARVVTYWQNVAQKQEKFLRWGTNIC